MSQIVMLKSSPKYHSLCGDHVGLPWQIVTMDDQAKNGGPNHLKSWREYRKLTQAELANRVGTNANMIGYLESGERGLSAKWLRKLADALKITPGHLLDHNPNEMPSDILEIWMNADPSVQRQIAEVAKALVRTGTDG
ncbi:helix-turn-helix domain-containing protein [Novosphingobium sp. JCM 18896]|uniref:helix-turn-helix domain-containing protein n=1 Tax=Novosphingobium sp. JCM 18896 TaxID=2989731 RepID=UPI002222B6AC|nr:helix-turn-helix transcriptional regulator [Novosphingobium sp. JCM 18896]MCW1431373.1 helix-turn-helix domain-containing protein [Novosphingobium sp. JCM 18896]